MARIASIVVDLVGGTPLVRINHVASGGVDMVAKVETFNPAFSMRDCIARSIIDATEASGVLAPGDAIVEATSGNTGIVLPMVGTACDYKVAIVIPASMSIERHAIVCVFGAELVLIDPEGGVSTAVTEAGRTASERPDVIIASQFTNPANPAAHVAHTGEEIWVDTDGQTNVFVVGVGTGGTISGVAKALKEESPNIRIIVVQPTESPLLTDDTPDPHGIQGLMLNFVSKIFDTDIVDEVISIETAHALELARRVVAEKGPLVGISSGATLAGAAAVVARSELAGRKIVTLLPDTGERYLPTVLFVGLED